MRSWDNIFTLHQAECHLTQVLLLQGGFTEKETNKKTFANPSAATSSILSQSAPLGSAYLPSLARFHSLAHSQHTSSQPPVFESLTHRKSSAPCGLVGASRHPCGESGLILHHNYMLMPTHNPSTPTCAGWQPICVCVCVCTQPNKTEQPVSWRKVATNLLLMSYTKTAHTNLLKHWGGGALMPPTTT